jgi:MFS transporter, YNFM family, putative membrane transport protein
MYAPVLNLSNRAATTALGQGSLAQSLAREILIGVLAFLTVVDLFATQAILPSLVQHYQVTPAAMGLAVNASTLGMAIGSLGVALITRPFDRRLGIIVSLALLAIPTALLASAPDLGTFTVLRIAQGLFMASAFTLTLAYLADTYAAAGAAGAFAAYITGNVASNLLGRLLSAGLADHLGLAANFYVFALLNVAGALLVVFTLPRTPRPLAAARQGTALGAWALHLSNQPLRATFGIGFCILYAFIGTFTYVNFVLTRPPLALSPMQLGFVYLVFLPSIATTPFAGAAVRRLGVRAALWVGLAVAAIGLPALLAPRLGLVLIGLALVGVGTFFAQATATGFLSRAASTERGAASGLYLAAYFSGGLIGSAVLGQVFDRCGWGLTVAGIGLALLVAAALTVRLRQPLA